MSHLLVIGGTACLCAGQTEAGASLVALGLFIWAFQELSRHW